MLPTSRFASASAGQANTPEVKAALQRLEGALVRHGSYSSLGLIMRLDAKDFRGCRITYELVPETPPNQTGYLPQAERTTVNLSALDLGRVEMKTNKKNAIVTFAARDGLAAIEKRFGESPHSFGEATAMRTAYLHMPNNEAATEVLQALRLAVEVCTK